jgi:hypothetical protein
MIHEDLDLHRKELDRYATAYLGSRPKRIFQSYRRAVSVPQGELEVPPVKCRRTAKAPSSYQENTGPRGGAADVMQNFQLQGPEPQRERLPAIQKIVDIGTRWKNQVELIERSTWETPEYGLVHDFRVG